MEIRTCVALESKLTNNRLIELINTAVLASLPSSFRDEEAEGSLVNARSSNRQMTGTASNDPLAHFPSRRE